MTGLPLKYYVTRFICWLLFFQLVNLSIDPPDIRLIAKNKQALKEANTANEIESFYELVSEELLDTRIPESEEQDIEKTITSVDLFFFQPALQSFVLSLPFIQHQDAYSRHFFPHYSDPLSPPPRRNATLYFVFYTV